MTMAVIAVITMLLVPEPLEVERDHISILNNPKSWFQTSYLTPFMDIANRYTDRIFLILLLVMSYRFSDFILGPMAMPFYQEVGFSKDQIALITKVRADMSFPIRASAANVKFVSATLSLIHI